MQIIWNKYNIIKLFLGNGKVYTMLLDGLRKQRQILWASNKNYLHKTSKSSAELAVYVLWICTCTKRKLRNFSTITLTMVIYTFTVKISWWFLQNKRLKCMQIRFWIPFLIKFWTHALTHLSNLNSSLSSTYESLYPYATLYQKRTYYFLELDSQFVEPFVLSSQLLFRSCH